MGFFKDFKDDFSQALNELLPGDDFNENEEIQVNTLDSELDVEKELSKLDGLLEQVEKKAVKAAETEPEPELEPLSAEESYTDTFDAQTEAVQNEEVQEEAVEAFDNAQEDTFEETIEEAVAEESQEIADENDMIIADDFETDMWSAEETTSETTEEVKENVTTVEKEPVQVQSEAAMQTNTMNYTADIAEAATSEPQTQNADEFEIQNDIIKEEKIMDTMDTNVMTETEVVAEPAVETVAPVAANNAVTDEVSVITAGTSIKGNMETTGSFEIEGRIEGDIKCNGKLTVIGSILGNSASSEFFADSAHIEGEVVSSGTVKVGLGSVIIGNITATSAVIAGAVKGDIDVQ